MHKIKLLYDDFPNINASIEAPRKCDCVQKNILPFFEFYNSNDVDVTKEPYIYPIVFGDIYTDLIYHNRFGLLPEYVLNALRDNDSKLYLMLWFPTEGFSLSTNPFYDIIDLCIKDLGIISKRVIMVFGDLNVNNNFQYWKKIHGWSKINVIGFEYFSRCYKDAVNKFFSIPIRTLDEYDEYRKKKIVKKFIFKNAVLRPHRRYMIGRLAYENLLDYSYWSMLDRYVKTFDTDTLDDYEWQRYDIDNDRRSAVKEHMIKLYSKGEKNFDFSLDNLDENSFELQWQMKSYYYNTSDITLTSETVFREHDDKRDVPIFLSEKTFQPIANFHPFLTFGSHTTLKVLKSLNFETFPELFDESYDTNPDAQKKIDILVKNLKSLCNGEKDDILQSNEIRDKLIHNQKEFFSRSTEVIYNKVFADQLKKIISGTETL